MQSNGNVKTLGNKKSNNGFVERDTERLKRHNFRKKLFAYFDFVMVFNFFDRSDSPVAFYLGLFSFF